ncbi:reverse transcriptase [Phytophthora megakarya]|uniref:Reverse transcriptase n=1 Tax=Phytophthora megakarya TaxID=4795 RepID=A0A225UC15_9STRA|nr:reverse transcriptase [Phytophthora megakarya]
MNLDSSFQKHLETMSYIMVTKNSKEVTKASPGPISEFYWPGMYADVEPFVKECVDCASVKGNPPHTGPSPGNIEPRQPFKVVSMDFVTHMPKSDRANTFCCYSRICFLDM